MHRTFEELLLSRATPASDLSDDDDDDELTPHRRRRGSASDEEAEHSSASPVDRASTEGSRSANALSPKSMALPITRPLDIPRPIRRTSVPVAIHPQQQQQGTPNPAFAALFAAAGTGGTSLTSNGVTPAQSPQQGVLSSGSSFVASASANGRRTSFSQHCAAAALAPDSAMMQSVMQSTTSSSSTSGRRPSITTAFGTSAPRSGSSLLLPTAIPISATSPLSPHSGGGQLSAGAPNSGNSAHSSRTSPQSLTALTRSNTEPYFNHIAAIPGPVLPRRFSERTNLIGNSNPPVPAPTSYSPSHAAVHRCSSSSTAASAIAASISSPDDSLSSTPTSSNISSPFALSRRQSNQLPGSSSTPPIPLVAAPLPSHSPAHIEEVTSYEDVQKWPPHVLAAQQRRKNSAGNPSTGAASSRRTSVMRCLSAEDAVVKESLSEGEDDTAFPFPMNLPKNTNQEEDGYELEFEM